MSEMSRDMRWQGKALEVESSHFTPSPNREQVEGAQYQLKPMNCPFHVLIS